MLQMISKAFAGVKDFVTNKFRLLIEYAMIGLLLIVAGLSFTLWLQREAAQKQLAQAQTQLVSVSARLNTVEQVNQRQDITIKTLNNLREQDSKSLTSLLNDYARLTGNDTSVRSQLSQLEKRNAKVQSYMDQPVPVELKCVLENIACPDAGTSSSH